MEPDEGEIVDGLPVVAETHAIEPAPGRAVPAPYAAALAATGFVAGAATVAVVQRRRARLPRRRKRKAGGLGEIVASNSFLVDVHLLRRP